MNIVKEIFLWIWQNGQITGFVIGFGFAFLALVKIFWPKIRKVNKACEEIDFLDSQTKGRISFANTISNHEIRIGLNERDINWMKDICDRRHRDEPVKCDRRINSNET